MDPDKRFPLRLRLGLGFAGVGVLFLVLAGYAVSAYGANQRTVVTVVIVFCALFGGALLALPLNQLLWTAVVGAISKWKERSDRVQ